MSLKDGAFIVGGQALNIWAERYSAAPELAAFGPYASKDLDYFGQRKAAEKLAAAIGGIVLTPSMDHATPQSAIVKATIDGREISIDFLSHVLGVKSTGLEKRAVELVMRVRTAEGEGALLVPIMHPFHCFQSRLANVVTLGRAYDLARRQLEASPIVLREYISEMLDEGIEKEATAVLQQLFAYLRADPLGRMAHLRMRNDPAKVLDHFADDPRIDRRFREMSLAKMRRQLAEKRAATG